MYRITYKNRNTFVLSSNMIDTKFYDFQETLVFVQGEGNLCYEFTKKIDTFKLIF